MILGILTLICSFILEGILSNFININTNIFSLMFTVVSIIVIYPYFYNREKKYLIYVFWMGFIYDIVYTNTLGLNAITFLVIAIIVKKLNSLISNNIFNNIFKAIIVIIVYRLINYVLLLLIGYEDITFLMFIKSITSSLIINIIYLIIINIVTNYISKKRHIVKIN